MQITSLRMYVGIVTALAVGSLFLLDWEMLDSLSAESWQGLLSLVILGLVSESLGPNSARVP